MKICCLYLLSFSLTGLFAADAPPLADALWKGKLTIEVQGQVRNHHLANRMGDSGPTGFLQEKSRMNVNFSLTVEFMVNNVGEVSKTSQVSFVGDESIVSEENFKFLEDVVLKGGITASQEVLQKETKETKISFNDPEHAINLSQDQLQILPGGRIDKKGKLQIEANMNFDYQGEGFYNLVKERTPPSKEFAVLEEKANLTRTFSLPLNFSITVGLAKKAIDTTAPVHVPLVNPFAQEDREGKDIYSDNLTAKCTLELKPLFGKYAD